MQPPPKSVLRRTVSTLLAACLLAGALAGCGQKGDLYLPDRPEQKPSPDDDNNNTT